MASARRRETCTSTNPRPRRPKATARRTSVLAPVKAREPTLNSSPEPEATAAVPAELWQPKIETEAGLAATARWYEAQGWL